MSSLTVLDNCLTTRQCLVWKTEKPFEDRHRLSPVFTFMDYKWRFQLIYDRRLPASYDVYMIFEGKLEQYPPFSVTTYVENVRKRFEPMFCSGKSLPSAATARELLWRLDRADLVKEIPDVDIYRIFTLVFVFDIGGSTLPLKETDHKSLQASLLDTGSSSSSSSPLLDLPFSLSCLSLDLESLLDKQTLSDVQLRCGGRTVPAHKAILAARSEVFAAMFRHDLAESRSGIIHIEDIDTTVLDVFLKFMYSGKIPDDGTPEDVISKLYAVGDKYSVGALKKLCSYIMVRNLSKDNFVAFLLLADAHSDEEFKNKMERIVLIFCMLTASSAIFFPFINLPNGRQSMMNICIYSVNPARYQPKCFLCPSTVYPNVLRACVNADAIPSNITYTQASCIEQNCAVGRGKRSVDLWQPDNALEDYENRVRVDSMLGDEEEDKDDVSGQKEEGPRIVGTEEFFASDYTDDDYETVDS